MDDDESLSLLYPGLHSTSQELSELKSPPALHPEEATPCIPLPRVFGIEHPIATGKGFGLVHVKVGGTNVPPAQLYSVVPGLLLYPDAQPTEQVVVERRL